MHAHSPEAPLFPHASLGLHSPRQFKSSDESAVCSWLFSEGWCLPTAARNVALKSIGRELSKGIIKADK